MAESRYWQHNKPLRCPKGHIMTWLGSAFWICGKGKCNTIFVQENANGSTRESDSQPSTTER